MKRYVSMLLSAILAAVILTACNTQPSSQVQSSTSTLENSVLENVGNSVPDPQPDSQPEGNQTAEVDEQRLQEIYDALSAAAGLTPDGVVKETATDLNAGGGITVDNILHLIGYSSIVGGDSGYVLVMQVAPGTAADMVKELEAYRAAFLDGPSYEEFAESQEAMGNARIQASGDIVVYVATSAVAGASYEDVDAVLAAVLGN